MKAQPSKILAAGLIFATLSASAAPAARAQSGRRGESPVLVQVQGNASPFSGQRAYDHVKKLVELGPRPSGSKGLELARQYILKQLGGDDHVPFLNAGVPAVDIIQLSTCPHWHTPEDTLDKISPHSLKAVGDAVLVSLPRIEEKLKEGAGG
jgi:hypothetical protein